ncbi:SUMF1/EgtB/PvdO family nonheme iron enzyme [Treponema bryantii]|uniref:SUMF1/EgtB/PvdO family nonheme iron enzyme n=1 Tax=Treponema bryantii TaxID=163 RepID=UPI0003B4C2F8|nr:SUMF1/EgtB/PvdO family nonheme iron enzyme [Treponema bryantii]
MKKKLLQKIIFSFLAVFLFAFFSCENGLGPEDKFIEETETTEQEIPESQKAYIVFNLVESQRSLASRAVTSAITSSLFSDITFSGHTSDNSNSVSKTAASFSELAGQTIEVVAGSWSFTLEAYLGKTSSTPGEKYTASKDMTVYPGSNEVKMSLAPDSASTSSSAAAAHPGSWNVTITFPNNADSSIDKVEINLYEFSDFTSASPTSLYTKRYVSGTDFSATGLQTLTVGETSRANGTYIISLSFLKNSLSQGGVGGESATIAGTEILNTWNEFMRINPGANSSGTISLTGLDKSYSITYDIGSASWNTTSTENIPISYTKNSGASGVITLPGTVIGSDVFVDRGSLYYFEGWYTSKDKDPSDPNKYIYSGPVTTFNVTDAENKTFYAKWHEPVYDIYVEAGADDSVADGTKTHPFSSVTLATYQAFDDITGVVRDENDNIIAYKSTIHILSDYTGTNKITVPWGNNDTSLDGMCVNLVGENKEGENPDVELDVCVGSGNSFIYLDHSQQMKLSHINITSSANHTNPNGFGCISVKGGSWLSFEDSTIKGYTGEGCSAINIEGVVHLKNCEISGNKAIDRDTSSSVWANAVNYGNGSLHLEGNVVIKSNKILKDDGSGNEESEAYNLYVGSYTGSLLNFMPIFINGNSLTGSEIWVKLAQEPHVFTTGYGTQSGEPSDYFHSDSGLVVDLDSSGEAQLVRRVSYYVSSTSSSPAGSDTAGDGSIEHPYASIEKAIEKITLNDDDTLAPVIYVSGEIPCNIIIDDGSVGSRLVAQSLTIQGSSTATQTILNGDINGDGAGDDSIILMSAQVPLTLKNLTLKNGNSTSSGGALCYDGRQLVTIDSCIIDNNEAAVYGGALYFSNSDAAISNTSFINNSVTGTVSDYGQGGAIYIRGGNVSVSGSSSFTSNSAYRYGGAIALSSSSSSVLTLGKAGVESTIVINENTAGSPAQTDNIHLNDGQTITVAGALSTDSEIGVTRTYSTDPFTTGYAGTNSGTAPDEIFTSDADYAVIAGTGGETAFYMTTAGGTVYMPGDYHFTLAASISTVTVGRAATVTVTPDITRTEPVGSPTPLFYNLADHKLYLDSVFTQPEGSNTEVTWTASLWCHGSPEYESLTAVTGTANANKFTIPALTFEDTYTLNVTATYQGYTHNADFAIQCQAAGSGTIPEGFVAVTGATVTGSVSGSSVFKTNRTVTIPNLYVCDHEVTQAEFTEIMGTNPSNFTSNPATGEDQENRPVENINWYAAIAYCNKKSLVEALTPCYTVSGITDWTNLEYSSIPTSSDSTWNAVTCDFTANGYRLPTEAEWEYIARGGDGGIPAEQTLYSGSNTIGDVAWYTDNSSSMSHEVKKKNANSLCIYDMSGNVFEWCWDWYGNNTTSYPVTGPASGSKRVARGGSWNVNYSIGTRIDYSPNSRNNKLGFRVVRTTE